MERPEEGGHEDPSRGLSESELSGAERGRLSKGWTGAEGLTAIPKIAGSPASSSAAGARAFSLGL